MKPARIIVQDIDGPAGQIIPFPRSIENAPVLLIADDDASARHALAEHLRARNFTVYEAASGVEAIDFAELRRPDLILLDIRMPDTDGVQGIYDLKAIPATADIPIIAIAPAALNDERDRHLAAGAVQFLTKPLHCDQVEQAIAPFLPNRQPPKNARSA